MKRLKKILKWTGIVLAALAAIGLVVNAWWVWSTDTRLERQLAALREAGEPLSIAELAPKPIPPEKNAATYLRRAEADVEALRHELFKVRGISQWPMPPAARKAVKAVLDAYPNVIPLLEKAAACPDYDAELDYTLPPKAFSMQLLEVAQKMRFAALFLQARALWLANEGNRDEAVRTALLMLRLARHFDRNPTLPSFFMAMAIRNLATEPANLALQTGPVSEHTRSALEAELALQDKMEGFLWTIKSDRAFLLDTCRTSLSRNFWLISRGLWNERELAFLDEIEAYLAVMREPIPYRQADEMISGIQAERMTVLGYLAGLTGIPMQFQYRFVAHTRAEMRTLRVLNALQTRVSPGSKEIPKLTNLGLPTEAITDPFTGQPLHVKKTPRGWLVYSVGQNLRDDGGKLDDPSNGDVGIGPPPVAKPAEKGQDESGKKGGQEGTLR